MLLTKYKADHDTRVPETMVWCRWWKNQGGIGILQKTPNKQKLIKLWRYVKLHTRKVYMELNQLFWFKKWKVKLMLCKTKAGHLLADEYEILERWKRYFAEIINGNIETEEYYTYITLYRKSYQISAK